MNNPFMEPFKDSDIPVLIVSTQVDEMVFKQIGTYKGFNYVNVESGYEEISKDLEKNKSKEEEMQERQREAIPEDEITNFCLWLKEQTKPYVGKVTISKRLKDVPMVLFGQVSANMRLMMSMMQSQSDNPEQFQKEIEAVSHN